MTQKINYRFLDDDDDHDFDSDENNQPIFDPKEQ